MSIKTNTGPAYGHACVPYAVFTNFFLAATIDPDHFSDLCAKERTLASNPSACVPRRYLHDPTALDEDIEYGCWRSWLIHDIWNLDESTQNKEIARRMWMIYELSQFDLEDLFYFIGIKDIEEYPDSILRSGEILKTPLAYIFFLARINGTPCHIFDFMCDFRFGDIWRNK